MTTAIKDLQSPRLIRKATGRDPKCELPRQQGIDRRQIDGERLITLRERRGLSQAALARESGVDAAQLSKYESTSPIVRAKTLIKIANALNASPETLLKDGERA